MRTRILLLLFVIFTSGIAAVAQSTGANAPVRWRMSAKLTSDTEGVLTLRAIIEPGWHLYDTSLPDNGPVPTTFNFDNSKGIAFTDTFVASVTPVTVDDPGFGITLRWWQSDVAFERHFTLTGSVDEALVEGSVRFMSCDNTNCTPPATVTFSSKLKPFIKQE